MDYLRVIAARSTNAALLPGERHILLLLATHANGPDTPWPSVQTIATESGYTGRRVQQILQSLEAKGVIIRNGIGGRSMTNSYELRLHVNHEAGFAEIAQTTKPVSLIKESNHEAGFAEMEGNHEMVERKPRNRKPETTKPTSPQEDVKKNVKITLIPKETGQKLLSDETYCTALRERFSTLDFDYETDKWLLYIEGKPPKGNYKLSLQNWLERATSFRQNGAQRNGTGTHRPDTQEHRPGYRTDGTPNLYRSS